MTRDVSWKCLTDLDFKRNLEAVAAVVKEHLPDAVVRVRGPRNPDGMWWMDVDADGHHAVMAWNAERGFGLTSGNDDVGYGEGPDEVFQCAISATVRVCEVMREKKSTRRDP
jgi:hypothetical protein